MPEQIIHRAARRAADYWASRAEARIREIARDQGCIVCGQTLADHEIGRVIMRAMPVWMTHETLPSAVQCKQCCEAKDYEQFDPAI